MDVFSQVLCQHADGASILWLRRDRAVAEPHFRLADLAKLDGRLEANLDGLRIAEAGTVNAAWDLCDRQLHRWEEPGEAFAAAVLALESTNEDRLDRVLESATSSYELSRPLVSAIAWLPPEAAAKRIERFLSSDVAALRCIGIAASAACRRDPGDQLDKAVEDPNEPLRARGLRTVGELGRFELLAAVRKGLDDESTACRTAAAWSMALLAGEIDAIRMLQRTVESGADACQAALQLALRRSDAKDANAWLLEIASRNPHLARSAVVGMGVIGNPDVMLWLLDLMATSSLSRIAGEAFAMITGVDIAYQDLNVPRPEGFTSGPNEDPDDENVEMDPDENLPWPDPAKISAWWQVHSCDFTPGTRYLLGKPMTLDWLNHVLREGYQRQRAAAALELAIRQPGTPLFEVRAPGFRQQELLR